MEHSPEQSTLYSSDESNDIGIAMYDSTKTNTGRKKRKRNESGKNMEDLERDEIGNNFRIATTGSAGVSVGFGGRGRGDSNPEIFESGRSLRRSRTGSRGVNGSAETPISSSDWENNQSGSHRSKTPTEKRIPSYTKSLSHKP